MDDTTRPEHATMVLLCECPRRDEKTHLHQRPTGEMKEVELPREVMQKLGQRGTKVQIPITEEVMVPGGVPRIVLRPVDTVETSLTTLRHYVGACARCGEVFSCTLSVEAAGLREPAPAAKEEADGDQGDGDSDLA